MDKISKILNFFKNKEVLFLFRLSDIMEQHWWIGVC